MEKRSLNHIGIVIALVVCLASILFLRPVLSSPDFYRGTIESLDDKKATVMKLVASSAASSTLLTMIPDDICTPIANQLTDLSTVFLIILAVLYAEKYLLTSLGFFSTVALLPAICALFAIHCGGMGGGRIRGMMVKLLVLFIACVTVIPVGVGLSDRIEATFDESISNTINTALQSEEKVEKVEDNKNIFGKIADAASSAFKSVGDAVDTAKAILGNYVEAIAIMFITSCLIPMLTLFVYLKIIKYVFNYKFSFRDSVNRTMQYRMKRREKDGRRQVLS